MVALIEGKCTGYRKRLCAIEEHLATVVEESPPPQQQQQQQQRPAYVQAPPATLQAAPAHLQAPPAQTVQTFDFADLRSQLQAPVCHTQS